MMPREVILQNLLEAQNRLDENVLDSTANTNFKYWSEVLETYDEGAGSVAWPFPTGDTP